MPKYRVLLFKLLSRKVIRKAIKEAKREAAREAVQQVKLFNIISKDLLEQRLIA